MPVSRGAPWASGRAFAGWGGRGDSGAWGSGKGLSEDEASRGRPRSAAPECYRVRWELGPAPADGRPGSVNRVRAPGPLLPQRRTLPQSGQRSSQASILKCGCLLPLVR